MKSFFVTIRSIKHNLFCGEISMFWERKVKTIILMKKVLILLICWFLNIVQLVNYTPMATTVARSGDECLKPGIGNWLLNKLLKQTFFWGKKYFFLKFHYIFHYKNFIKSLIFKIFFSACFALCWHFPRRYGVSSSICPNYLLWSWVTLGKSHWMFIPFAQLTLPMMCVMS